jgi:SpoVK/Ycf46/Vps4 family AAA+-type ATPase
MDKTYLFAVLKIVEGAANADQDKVASYAEQLCERLEADGETEGARRLRQILRKTAVSKMGLARAGGNQAMGASHFAVPVDSESRLPTADEERLERGEVELFLSEDVEKFVQQFLTYFRAADRLIEKGVGVTPSLLMSGPPGCGKTLLARYIASELGLPLITARMDGIISSYLGSTAKNLRLLFEHAMSRPCVLFLDEFDALAKMRDDAKELGELKRVVISLLQNIDAMGKEHVLLAATNHEHLLDPAIWRRFAYKLHLAEPDDETRTRIVRRFFGEYASDELVEVVTALGRGLSGAHLRQIADDCIRGAVLEDRTAIPIASAVQAVFAAKDGGGQAQGDRASQMRALRELDPRTFTQVRLAKIYGLSQSRVSKLMREQQSHE